MTNEIRLVIPAEEEFRPIAHLVAGGLALRLDVTYDDLEDIQVALEALLALRDDADDVAVTLGAEDGTLRAEVGPFAAETVTSIDDDAGELGVRRVLETVVDSFEIEERGDGVWVELAKRVAAPAGAGGAV
jgi:hypothetical protein